MYDLHVHSSLSTGSTSPVKLAVDAKKLGLNGISLTDLSDRMEWKTLENNRKAIYEELDDFKILLGAEIKGTSTYELKKQIKKFRKKCDLILVHGGDLKINRWAVKEKEVDILAHPELYRQDSGLDHGMVRLAEKNDVAIELNFRNLLSTSHSSRARLIEKMRKNLRLCLKYNARVIVTSGAHSTYDLRGPYDFRAFLHILGAKEDESKRIIEETENIVTKWGL
ncbi:MAG: RNase P subunit p30 family protein [Candidatus Hydrothermarchaeota archaeon]